MEPALLRALPQLAACLKDRYPAASSALVKRCIDQAIVGFRDATVRKYLPILVERSAFDALRDALRAPVQNGDPGRPDDGQPSRQPREGEPTRRLTTGTTSTTMMPRSDTSGAM